VTQKACKKRSLQRTQFEHLPEKLAVIHELIATAYKNKTNERLPANPVKLAELLGSLRETISSTATVETFTRWQKEIELIEKDLELAQRHTQAVERATTDETARDKAKVMLEGYGTFWKELQPVLKALVMLDQLRRGVFQLTGTVIEFWKDVVKRTMDEYKGRTEVLDRIVELDRIFSAEARKLKQMVGM
jgi:hypothetical protein